MRRADRLFQLVQLVRGRRLSTAEFLADRLQVSLRTVYRDVADLQRQGVPIEGEAGVGYRMRKGFDLPPLMFTAAEAQALVASVRLARPRFDPVLAQEAEGALGKIFAILPSAARAAAEGMPLYAPPMGANASGRERLEPMRLATESHHKLWLRYRDLKDTVSERVVRPLGCFYWSDVWTLAVWCETREDFRNFRIDRVLDMRVLDVRFPDEPGRTLPDMLRAVNASSDWNGS
jgi:predicted DNA-binding transcriptional regulator YafY